MAVADARCRWADRDPCPVAFRGRLSAWDPYSILYILWYLHKALKVESRSSQRAVPNITKLKVTGDTRVNGTCGARSQVGGAWRHRSVNACGGYELYLVRNFPPPVRECGVPAGAAEAAAVAVAPGRTGSKQWRETWLG